MKYNINENGLVRMAFVIGSIMTMAFTVNNVTPETEEALAGIISFYENHPTIYQEISYQLFESHESNDIHSIENGTLILDKGSKYSKLGSIESLTNKNYNIGIDNDEKAMIISNNFSNRSFDPLEDIQAYIEQLTLVELKSVSKEVNILKFEIEYGEIAEAQVYYRKIDFQIEKIILKYRQKIQLEDAEDSAFVQTRLEIIYSNTSFDGYKSELLDMNRYIKESGKGWNAVGYYAKYQLINNLHENPFNKIND